MPSSTHPRHRTRAPRAVPSCAALLVALLAAPLTSAAAQGANRAPQDESSRPVPSLAEDRAAIRRAVLDYVEGFYEGDTEKVMRSVAASVVKSGYSRPHPDSAFRRSTMPYPTGFAAYTQRVREGRTRTPAGAKKEVTLLDVQDQTASAKLTAWWGTDYLLLAREGDRWLITHVLWQSTPVARR